MIQVVRVVAVVTVAEAVVNAWGVVREVREAVVVAGTAKERKSANGTHDTYVGKENPDEYQTPLPGPRTHSYPQGG